MILKVAEITELNFLQRSPPHFQTCLHIYTYIRMYIYTLCMYVCTYKEWYTPEAQGSQIQGLRVYTSNKSQSPML